MIMKNIPPILEYLSSLDISELNELYCDIFTIITIFRALPILAQQYIYRILWIDTDSISYDQIFTNISDNAIDQHNEALDILFYLKIFEKISKKEIKMNKSFQNSLKLASLNQIPNIASSTKVDIKLPSLIALKEYADVSWQKILHFMVASGNIKKDLNNVDNSISIQNNVRELILQMDLMKETKDENDTSKKIVKNYFKRF